MHPGQTYSASVWVKVNQTEGAVNVRFYTASNSEVGRLTSDFTSVTAADGWKRIKWTFTDPPDSESDSLSINWNGLTGRMWLSSPQLEEGAIVKQFISLECENGDSLYTMEMLETDVGLLMDGWEPPPPTQAHRHSTGSRTSTA